MGPPQLARGKTTASRDFWVLFFVVMIACSFTPATSEARNGKYVSRPVVTTDGKFTGVNNFPFSVAVRKVVTPAKAILADGSSIALDGVSLEGVPPAIYEKGLRLSKRLLEGKTVSFWGRDELPDGTTLGRILCSSGIGFHPLVARDSLGRTWFKWTETVDLNAELVAQGFARVDTAHLAEVPWVVRAEIETANRNAQQVEGFVPQKVPTSNPDIEYLLGIEKGAQREGRGLWGMQ